MSIIPINSSQTIAVPATIDWVAVSKIFAIELVFVGSSAAVVFGHGTPDIIALAGSTGVALGVLRVTDILANVINVKSFLNRPDSGVVPQAVGTPLIQTTPVKNGSSAA